MFRDKMSGFIWARITRDKSIASSTDALDKYMHTFDRPITIVSDGGPAFNHGFVDFVRARHILHRYSSAYRPQSNSPAERAVKSLKDVLEKLSKLDTRTLREVVFNVNNHVSQNDSGSNAERFFLRGIRSNLPNSFRPNLNVDDLIRIRSDKRQKAAEKMGRRSADEFEVGQVVRVQDTVNKHWKKKGEIIEARTTDDGQHASFRVRMENGHISTRHRVHLKPDVTRNTRLDSTLVTFAEEPQTLGKNPHSAGPSSRTRSKEPLADSGEKPKSCLKPTNHL